MRRNLQDDAIGYGTVTRLMHWGIAALLLFQFFGMVFKLAVGRTPLTSVLVGLHAPMGTLLLLLCTLRWLWALKQRRRRLSLRESGWSGWIVRIGHASLYALMLVVPALAILRKYGQGEGFTPFGIPLMEVRGDRIEWMVAVADRLHGELAWLLLALIAGHMAMVLLHQFWIRDETLSRMLGRRSP